MAVTLVPEGATVAPGGRVTLALVMEPEPGWHGYWRNPGDAGTESQVEWTLPNGASVGELRYPVPETLTIAGIMNYVYEHDYALLTELRVPAGVKPGDVLPIRASLDYLVCTREICVPESAEVAAQVTIGAPAQPGRFDGYRAALPRPIGGEGRFAIEGGKARIAIPYPASESGEGAYFFPLTHGLLKYSAAQEVRRDGDTLIIETDAPGEAAGLKGAEGLLKVGERGLWVTLRPGPIAAGTAEAGLASTILLALLGAVLGGLILNIMPCVFPILSLKALSLARTGESEGTARREALAYAAGVILVCLALGGALLALRAGGAAVGWAFQLQDPRVIIVLLLLVTAIALNLAGLFDLRAVGAGQGLAGKGGVGGAFWTGVLAAFVATPCTGPFMGAAMGAALILPTAAALAVFAGLGLGLALPFLLLGFVPALRRRLPKPGLWMDRLRRILSVPMFLTALGLAWILGRQAGVDGMTIGLAAATVLGLALWWVGQWQGRVGLWLPLVPAAAAAALALAFVPTAATAPAMASAPNMLNAEPFTEARLASLQQEGRPVFVYFTADWCLTCKVNEKGAIERKEVAKAFADAQVAVLVGDWTRGDATIGRFLERHGRSGVPLYLYYQPGKPAEILPQVLTPSRLVSMVS
ncbi:MAG TPA: protein-disulfide reductase DsbD domain-containing protein [Allosphingosinicella sp.]|uniref:protein-disulfide reductase DsbD family protein n=1 Tax=Allosphingosinicella sp. TaxID=2823234 RepID=UPI002EDA94E1